MLVFERVDCGDVGPVGLDAAVICRSEQFAGDTAKADHQDGPFSFCCGRAVAGMKNITAKTCIPP